jgi:hypothetical protein
MTRVSADGARGPAGSRDGWPISDVRRMITTPQVTDQLLLPGAAVRKVAHDRRLAASLPGGGKHGYTAGPLRVEHWRSRPRVDPHHAA